MSDLEKIEKDVDMLKESMIYLKELTYAQSQDIDTLEDHIQQYKKEMSEGTEEISSSSYFSYSYYPYAILAGILWFIL
jgi:t-SNARE complex subunit (syntaxin)